MRTSYETALVRVKGLIRDHGNSSRVGCFISYAWGNKEDEQKILQLTDDLRKADIDVLLNKWNNSTIGTSIAQLY